ncbi:Mini-ribonuclease 3 [uncultured Limosilactobacillus sp.]|uniref:Mini-ribonuclease 3 n=1 Tax=uncultured Limosilactobacillus sp. TaxID=2837629 RepID=UPI0025E6ADE5|nr:Mini-ribonuclease 3 [uncultured Limosilactobacillus sp.]
MATVDQRQLNGIALAYLGDAVYEVFIRQRLLDLGMSKPDRLQKKATHYVSAKAQADLVDLMADEDILTEVEWAYYKRGRNAKSYTHAKNTSILTYRQSTGFEALFGYLKVTEQTERIEELASWCIHQVERGRTEQNDK